MEFSLNKEKQELFIKTAIWNSIIEFFKMEKNIDVSDFLISIQIKENNILVKTGRPLLNHECNIYKQRILDIFYEKIKNLEFDIKDIDIKFI